MTNTLHFGNDLRGNGVAEGVRVETFVDKAKMETVTKLKLPEGLGWRVIPFSCPEDLVAFGEEISRIGRGLASQVRPVLDSLLQEKDEPLAATAITDSTSSNSSCPDAFFWHDPEACSFGFAQTEEEAREKAEKAVVVANNEARHSDGIFADGELQICYGAVIGRAVVSSEKPYLDFAPLLLQKVPRHV